MSKFNIFVATEEHLNYVDVVLNTIADAAKVRGTGIARRSPEYLQKKIEEGKAIMALHGEEFAGFCYIETWGHDKFVANSGLIVVDKFRGHGLAKDIKTKAFELSREKYPQAKIFGLTTGLAVMKINSDLGYRPVTFSELTDDEQFWKGCQSCVNYDILVRTERKHCLCTGMLFDPDRKKNGVEKKSGRVLSRIKNAVKRSDSKLGRTLKSITALF
ncbi:MAG: GNAT family N-acetyltransferase [Bacteroidales bacterium]|nr:GNAT family N-acetyltransferase [Bacteroidales bacterium]